jgi:hypothetical protein
VQIDWGTLTAIAVVAAATAVTVVLLVAFALLGLSASAGRRTQDRSGSGVSGLPSAAGTAVAVFCLVAAGLIVCYGLFLIIS